MRARGLVLALALALLAWSAPAGADLPTVTHEGRSYVELGRVAAALQTRTDTTPSSVRAYLRLPKHVVTLTRNTAQVLVDGAPVVLDAPVRVREGVWLVPESFVSRVLPRIVGAATLAVAGPPAAPELSLEDLRYRSYPSFTRVVLETSAPVAHAVEAQGAKELRIRVRGLAAAPREEEIRDGFIDTLRLERAGADVLVRITFEGVAGTLRPLTLEDPPRLVLDLMRPTDEPKGERGALVTPLRTIVLDAGHGGHDSGAVGPSGLMEKELVLDVTLRVKKLVEDQLGLKVLVTRDNDTFVPLRDRTSFANKERADLFVSIHANAHRQSATDGVETYFLSSEATDSTARQVAALENGVVQLEQAGGGRGSGRVDIVRTILWDLAQSEFQLESSRLAEIVQDAMTASLRIPSRGVKQAGFYVLGGAAMPAILLEIGFVTNPREERRLRSTKYRDEIARAIFAGLGEYKRQWDRRTRTASASPTARTR